MNNGSGIPQQVMPRNISIMGTPKTLDQAIELALCVGPMTEVKERMYVIIKDFLANKFQVSVLMAVNNDVLEDQLKDLFEQLTKR